MRHDIVDDAFRHQLKGDNIAATRRLTSIEQVDGRFDITQTGKGCCNGMWFWEQLHDSGGDNAERAFSADKQVFQIIPCIVLFQRQSRFITCPSAATTSSPRQRLRVLP